MEKRLLHIRDVMHECQANGMARTGMLAWWTACPAAREQLVQPAVDEDPDRSFEHAEAWVNLVAMAVNEENASGGRVVTAPTNGAAGIIPAVLHYAENYTPRGRSDPDGVADRLPAHRECDRLVVQASCLHLGRRGRLPGEVGSAASMAARGTRGR